MLVGAAARPIQRRRRPKVTSSVRGSLTMPGDAGELASFPVARKRCRTDRLVAEMAVLRSVGAVGAAGATTTVEGTRLTGAGAVQTSTPQPMTRTASRL